MNDTVIRVESLSKRYRIGLKKTRNDTFFGAVSNLVRLPLKNFQRLRGLTSFREGNQLEPDVIWALNDVSLEVKRGEVVGIIGFNGSGKTTLLKILSRVTEPTSGRAELSGRVSSLLEVGTGFHPELSGRDNIYLNGSVLGMTRTEIRAKFDEIVEFSGVSKFIDTPVKRYSSGMQVRLAFAVAAHLEPEILLVDEVLAVGDYDFQQKCLGKMEEVSKSGRTVLLVSHNMASILNLCDTALLLNQGRTERFGESSDVVRQYLTGNSSLTGEVIWDDQKDAPGDDKLRLHYVRVGTEYDNPTADIDMQHDIDIELCYWNLVEGTKIWTGIHVFNEMGVHVLASTNMPSETLGSDDYWNTPCPVGLFKSVCRIPRRLLNSGSYKITAAVGINGLEIVIRIDNAVTFKIHDSISVLQKSGKPPGGIIRPQLAWSTEPVACSPRATEC